MNQKDDDKKRNESSDTVEHSTVVSRTADNNSNNEYWSASPYFLEILIPIISSFLLLRRRDLFGRLLLNLDKNCFSALCPSLSKREHLLKWAQRGTMPSWMPCPMNISLTLDDVWKNGSLLCTLINSAVSGACPNPHRHRNKPPTHGQALAYKYFGLAPMFTNEDFDQDLTGNLEFMFFMYLTQLRTNIGEFSSTDPSDMKYTSSYIARGMGLVTGEQYKKCVFYLYPNLSENDTGVLVTIKGPYHAYGCITLPPFYILKTSSGRNKKKEIVYAEEDIKKLTIIKTKFGKHHFRSITSAIIPFLKNVQQSPATSKIRIEANKEPDRIKLTYVPQHPGVHIMCIVTDGCHLQGSPFNVSVSESNVEEIQKETGVAKTELACDPIPEKSKPLNESGWMNTVKNRRYFNKSTCGQTEPHLFEKYNRINYQKFCKKFELFRSSFDERQEFSLDDGFFTNNEVKFLKRNSKASERFTEAIQKVMKMVKHAETNRNNNDNNNERMIKSICDDRTNTFGDQQLENVNKKIRYFENGDKTIPLEGIVMIENPNVMLKRNAATEFVLAAPKRTRKRQNDSTLSLKTEQPIIKLNKSSFVECNIKRIPSDPDSLKYNIEIKEVPALDSDLSGDIPSQKYNFNKIFEVQDSKEKGKLNVGSVEDARIDNAENNSFFRITGTESKNDGNATARSKKTITSESNNTSSNFSTECEVDKTKNAITEQSDDATLYSKEISENKNMFTNEKIIKNIADKNGILYNGKTSEAKRIFEGDQQHLNSVENFKGIDIWQNRADGGGKTHEKDEKTNSVKMKIFTYDNSANTQKENKLRIDHQREHNDVTENQKFSLVKNRKEIFDNKSKMEQNTLNYTAHKKYSSNREEKISQPSEKGVSGENTTNNFLAYSPPLETSTQHAENYLDNNNSTLKNLGKKSAVEEMINLKNGSTIEELVKESKCNAIGSIIKTAHSNSKHVQSPAIIEENIFIKSSEELSDHSDFELELSSWEENSETKSEDKPINSSNNSLDFLLDRVNSLIDRVEQEKKHEETLQTSGTSNPEKLDERLDYLLDKVDNLIDNIELEEQSSIQQNVLITNDSNQTINLGNDLEFLMNKINKLIDNTEAEKPEKRKVNVVEKYSEYQQLENTDLNVNTDSNPEIEQPYHNSSVLTMIRKFEKPFMSPMEKEENLEGITESRSTFESMSYLKNQDRFITTEKDQLDSQQGYVKATITNGQELKSENNNLNSTATKSSTVPSTPSSKTSLNRKAFCSTKSQSYPSYNELPTNEFFDLMQKRNSIESDSDDKNCNNKTSKIYIVTDRKETEIRKNIYTHSYLSPTTDKIQEIYKSPLKTEQSKEDILATKCGCEEGGKSQFEATHRPANFSSIINKAHSVDDETFPDVSGFLKENNRQHPHVDYPKDFSVSRRVSRIESLQSLLAQNNMYVTSQIHRSHPNIYFGERPKREKARKPWRKLKSFDANLLTASTSETRNDANTSRYDNCTKFLQSGDIIEERFPTAACYEGTIKGNRTSQIIKSSETQQAERRSQGAVSNYQINQEGLHDGTTSNRQLSQGHPDGFPSVKDLRSKFEKNAKPTADENSNKNTRIKGTTRSLGPDKYCCLDSSEETSTSPKYSTTLINSTHPNRENNIIKPLKRAKNIFSSIEVKASKNQPELTLTSQREEGVKENHQPLVSKTSSRHHFNGGCKQGTTSPPQYRFIKTPEATNSIRSEKQTRQVVEHDKGKMSERGNDDDEKELETVDVKNIMKNQFTKARNFFKELETDYFKKRKLSIRGIKKKRKKSSESCCLPKVWEKFPVRNIYKDVVGEKRGSFKGAANRMEVANSMASVPVLYKYFESSDSTDTLPRLDIFRRSRRPKRGKSLKSIFQIDY